MRGSDDLSPDMAFLSSSDRTEQLITGRSAPDDLPDASARVARLLTALRSPTLSDGAGEQEAVSTIVAAIAAAPVSLDTARRRRMLAQLLTAKAAAAAAAVLLVGTGAAAATGSLPDAAQSSVSRALAHVDVSVPSGDDHGGDHAAGADDHPKPGDHGAAIGPDATGPAKRGLCTAWAARGKGDTDRGNSGNSVAFTNLRHTARDAGMLVKEYCHDVLTVDPKSPDDDSSDPSGDEGQSTDHRTNGDQSPTGDHGPAVDTPNSGGIDTDSGASDGANSGGTDHAPPPASDGSDNSGGDHGSSSGQDHQTDRP